MNGIDILDLLENGYEVVARDYPEDDGFEHICFGCSPDNPYGMNLVFYGEPGGNTIVTRYIVRQEYCGFPLFTHGGIIGVLFDELLAYVCYHVAGNFGMTKSMEIKYKKPVEIGKVHFITGEVVNTEKYKDKGLLASTRGKIYQGTDDSGKVCATATADLVVLHKEKLKFAYKREKNSKD